MHVTYSFFSVSRNVRNSISFSRDTYAEIDGITSMVHRKITGLNYLFFFLSRQTPAVALWYKSKIGNVLKISILFNAVNCTSKLFK